MAQHPKPSSPKVDEGFSLWGNQSTSRRNRLIEFKAGKMNVRENMVHPDSRKGLAYIYQDEENMMHFCWMDRSRGILEVDLITMPEDCLYKKIEKCTTGRVFMLKMLSSKRVFFFWMQEPSSANDAHICSRVNSLLNFPPPRIIFPEMISNNELQFILNQLNADQFRTLRNDTDHVAWMDTGHDQPSDSRHIESTAPSSQGSEQPVQPPEEQIEPLVNFIDVINEESVEPICMNEKLTKKVEKQLPPIEGSVKANLKDTVRSSQFKEALEQFTVALHQGALGPVLRETDVNEDAIAAAEQGNVDSFAALLQAHWSHVGQSSGLQQPNPPGPETRKHPHGVDEEIVETAQQTEPVKVKPLPHSSAGETKFSTRRSPNDSPIHERGQNTDPVRIEEIEKRKPKTPDRKPPKPDKKPQ